MPRCTTSLLSGVKVVAEDSDVEERLSSLAQPAREASAKAATQVRIKVEWPMEVFVIFIGGTICRDGIRYHGVNTPHGVMGHTPHSGYMVSAVYFST